MNLVIRMAVSVMLLLTVQVAQAFTVRFTWVAPTTYTDGSSLAGKISSYKLYSTPVGSTKKTLVAVITKTATAYTYNTASVPTKAGKWCFFLSTFDINRVESVKTPAACIDYVPVGL